MIGPHVHMSSIKIHDVAYICISSIIQDIQNDTRPSSQWQMWPILRSYYISPTDVHRERRFYLNILMYSKFRFRIIIHDFLHIRGKRCNCNLAELVSWYLILPIIIAAITNFLWDKLDWLIVVENIYDWFLLNWCFPPIII